MTAATLAMGVVAPVTSASAETARSAPASLVWAPCVGIPEPTLGLECATIDVPLDYAAPEAGTIELAISRLPSTQPSERRGVLLLNPGGQGNSQLGLPLTLVALGLPESVRETYDILGVDPRGIGRSSPVTCNLPPIPEFLIPPPYAENGADVERYAESSRLVAAQCAGSPTAALLPYITTNNVARDMDQIREALGEQKISYLGYSYGVYLGAVYATMFPHRTDRFVLDSAVGPGGMDATWSRRVALGFEIRFPDFARWVAPLHDTYGLGRTPGQVRATFFELAERLEREPVGGIDGALFRWWTHAFLLSDFTFPTLAETWRDLDQGVAPRATQLPADNPFNFSGQLHLMCNDSDWASDLETYQRRVERDRARFPMFGAAGANIWPCAFWPSEPIEPAVRIGDDGPSNILIVQNLRDNGTPYVGALEMRRALGSRARLLTVDQGGHLAYVFAPNACANERTTRFLVTGERPKHDSFCPR